MYKGIYVARITIRHSGSFDFKYYGKRIAANYKYCKVIKRCSGYDYKCVHAK